MNDGAFKGIHHSSFIIKLSLPLFESGVLFVDHIELALTTDDLTVNRTFLDGWLDLHDAGSIRLLFLCK